MGSRVRNTMTTSAAVAGSEVGHFELKGADFNNRGNPLVILDGLAGAETATLYVVAGSSAYPVSGGDYAVGTEALTINSPGTYCFIKDATAGAVDIIVSSGQ